MRIAEVNTETRRERIFFLSTPVFKCRPRIKSIGKRSVSMPSNFPLFLTRKHPYFRVQAFGYGFAPVKIFKPLFP